MFPIIGVVQKYAWGKIGNDSEAARLYSKSSEKCVVENDIPYAELWLGTHTKAPSRVENTGEELSVCLKNSFASKEGEAKEACPSEGQLPFLLKVLSINKALSIQIHPNKSEAGELHCKDPKNYPDANHKPEMTIALTPFEALCSFRPLPEIHKYIQDIEELRELVTRTDESTQKQEVILQDDKHLGNFFKNLMMSDKEHVKNLADKLYQRSKSEANALSDPAMQLFIRLMDQHPGDVGCFCAFFLNHITLQPGQSLFLRSNLPHAYISGDCIECMACSDNVIRAGLTGKFRDVETLCRLVDYVSMPPSQVLFTPYFSTTHSAITTYNPPVPEFAVDKIELPKVFSSFSIGILPSHSILLLVKGHLKVKSGESELVISEGKSVFVEGGRDVVLEVVQVTGAEVGAPTLLFRAYSTDV